MELKVLEEKNASLEEKALRLSEEKDYLAQRSKDVDQEATRQILRLKEQYMSEIQELSQQIDQDKRLLSDLELENTKLLELVDILKDKLEHQQKSYHQDKRLEEILIEKDKQIGALESSKVQKKIRIHELEEQNNVILATASMSDLYQNFDKEILVLRAENQSLLRQLEASQEQAENQIYEFRAVSQYISEVYSLGKSGARRTQERMRTA